MRKILYSIIAICFLLGTLASSVEAAQNWRQIYTRIEEMVQMGVNQYKSGDLAAAKKTINNSYFGFYE